MMGVIKQFFRPHLHPIVDFIYEKYYHYRRGSTLNVHNLIEGFKSRKLMSRSLDIPHGVMEFNNSVSIVKTCIIFYSLNGLIAIGKSMPTA